MRRDQHPAIGPQLHHRRPLEFANIDIERGAAQVIAVQRIEKGILVDDLATGNVDQHAALHYRQQAACVRRLAQEAMMPAPRDRLADVALQYEKLAEGAEAGYRNPE